jgi:hypothetical protein
VRGGWQAALHDGAAAVNLQAQCSAREEQVDEELEEGGVSK